MYEVSIAPWGRQIGDGDTYRFKNESPAEEWGREPSAAESRVLLGWLEVSD